MDRLQVIPTLALYLSLVLLVLSLGGRFAKLQRRPRRPSIRDRKTPRRRQLKLSSKHRRVFFRALRERENPLLSDQGRAHAYWQSIREEYVLTTRTSSTARESSLYDVGLEDGTCTAPCLTSSESITSLIKKSQSIPAMWACPVWAPGLQRTTLPLFEATVGKEKVKCALDTMAFTSFISPAEAKRLNLKVVPGAPVFFNGVGSTLECSDYCEFQLMLDNRPRLCRALVSPHTPDVAELLIGHDWLKAQSVVFDTANNRLLFGASSRRGKDRPYVAALTEVPDLKEPIVSGKVPLQVLKQFPRLFSEPDHLPPSRPTDVRFRLAPGKTIAPSEQIVIKKLEDLAYMYADRDKLLKRGFISPHPAPKHNPFCAFVVHDKGSDSRGQTRARTVYDLRQPNAAFEIDPPQLPRILDIVRSVTMLEPGSSSVYYDKYDLRDGFHNTLVHPDSREFLVFHYPGDPIPYQWNVLPMGAANGPGAFQQVMAHILRDLIIANPNGITIYLDDILLRAPTKEKLSDLRNQVFKCLEENDFHLKEAKCALELTTVNFLGYELGQGTYRPMMSHVQGILDFTLPTTVKAWQRFHGMVNFYRLHITALSNMAKPITAIFNKKGKIEPTDELKTAFSLIKKAIAERMELTAFDPSLPVYLNTDASPYGWGAIVTQNRDLKRPGLAMLSGTFTPAEQAWKQNERELFAVVQAIRKYPQFFRYENTIVLTDNDTIVSWRNMKMGSSDRLLRWNETLLEVRPKFIHIPASENVITDALSRQLEELGRAKMDDLSVLNGLDVPTIAWIGKRFPRAKPNLTLKRTRCGSPHPNPPSKRVQFDLQAREENIAPRQPRSELREENNAIRHPGLIPASLVLAKLSLEPSIGSPHKSENATFSALSVSTNKSENTFGSPQPSDDGGVSITKTNPILGWTPRVNQDAPWKDSIPPISVDPEGPRTEDGIPKAWIAETATCSHNGCYLTPVLDGKCLKHHTTSDRRRTLARARSRSRSPRRTTSPSQTRFEDTLMTDDDLILSDDNRETLAITNRPPHVRFYPAPQHATCWRDCRTRTGSDYGFLCETCQSALNLVRYHGPILYSENGFSSI